MKRLIFIAVCIFIFSCIPFQVNAQTKIDLRSQSRNVDFSQSQSVRPFRTGTTLPPTCTAGEMFFNTDAPAGSNVYGCASANVWAAQSGTSTDPGTSIESDFLADLNVAEDKLTIVCPTGQCNTRTGDAITSFSSVQATYVPATGSYTAFIFVEGSTLKYGYSGGTMTTCNLVCTDGIIAFPANVVPLYKVAVSGGAFQESSLIDMRSKFQAVKHITAGSNVTITETADSLQIDSVATGGGSSVTVPLSTPVLGSDALGNLIPASESAYSPGIPGQAENLTPNAGDFLNLYNGSAYSKVKISNLPGGYYGATRNWWVSTGDFSGLSSIQMTSAPNLIRAYMVYLTTKVQFGKISLLRTSVLTGTITGAAGIYSATKTLIAQTGPMLLSNSSTANVAISASIGNSVLLEPGQYYVVYSADASTAAVGGISLFGGLATLLNSVIPGVMYTSNVSYSNVTGLPASLGTLTRDGGGFAIPAIVLQQ